MENKTKNLFINAILLSITMMIMRSIGVVFNVYISNEIGTEGMGLYKLIGTVSMIAITFATSGISSAVTRIVAEEMSKQEYNNVKYVVFKASTICGVLGITASIILFAFSKNIALIFLKDTRVILSIKIFAIFYLSCYNPEDWDFLRNPAAKCSIFYLDGGTIYV